ncbi:hypothetical protein P7K49_014877 [Saguinus oedipus]|uniref:Uncharacterized protein n=1 Tax=Saguinus oedipus TaxID=9490 RepID=A0ABQ9V7M8_SAGOE|nr:hypothetical protein P7K49_014877 [Saguinus oedipus]
MYNHHSWVRAGTTATCITPSGQGSKVIRDRKRREWLNTWSFFKEVSAAAVKEKRKRSRAQGEGPMTSGT